MSLETKILVAVILICFAILHVIGGMLINTASEPQSSQAGMLRDKGD
jgi:hypothetical protein